MKIRSDAAQGSSAQTSLPYPVRMMAENNHELPLSASPSPHSLGSQEAEHCRGQSNHPTPVSSSFLPSPSPTPHPPPPPIPSQYKRHRCPSFPSNFPLSPLRMLSTDAREAGLPGTLRTARPPSPPTAFLPFTQPGGSQQERHTVSAG